jgi:hypothetical protein
LALNLFGFVKWFVPLRRPRWRRIYLVGTAMADDQTLIEKYRREAATIRKATKSIRDERFCEQLLLIADRYEARAGEIEADLAAGSSDDSG